MPQDSLLVLSFMVLFTTLVAFMCYALVCYLQSVSCVRAGLSCSLIYVFGTQDRSSILKLFESLS